MTAYLKPGDVIHIAYPISPTLYGIGLRDAQQETQTFLKTIYGQRGVTISGFTASTALDHPVVIAVFRNDTEAESASAT